MSLSIIKQVSDYLGYSKNETVLLSHKAPRTYKHYRINKKKGGTRTIHHPSRQTKSLQYAIIEIVLRELKVSKYALAYKRGKGSATKKMHFYMQNTNTLLWLIFKIFFIQSNQEIYTAF